MKYQGARQHIRSGDIFAWSHRGIRSWHDLKIWFVRLFTRSEYSHVGVAWVVGERVFVIEAVMPLVRIYPLSALLEDGAFWLCMGAQWKPDTEAYALSKVGQRYSQLEAVQAPFEEPPDNNLWQCAELVTRTLYQDGINLGNVHTPSAVVYAALLGGATLNVIEA